MEDRRARFLNYGVRAEQGYTRASGGPHRAGKMGLQRAIGPRSTCPLSSHPFSKTALPFPGRTRPPKIFATIFFALGVPHPEIFAAKNFLPTCILGNGFKAPQTGDATRRAFIPSSHCPPP